jgi:hypothetical protein
MKKPILALLVLACACSTPDPRNDVQLSASPAATSPGPTRISIQLTVADMPRARADQLFGADDPNGGEVGPEFTRQLDELARAGAGVEIESRPTLLLLDAHRGYIEVGSPESYVQDFEVDEASGVADPVIGTMWEGLRFEAQPEVRADGSGVDLDFHLEISTLERPIPESTFELPDLGLPVTVQMPASTTLSENRRITLRPGRVFAFVLHPESDEEDTPRSRVVAIAVDFPEGAGTAPAGSDAVEIRHR